MEPHRLFHLMCKHVNAAISSPQVRQAVEQAGITSNDSNDSKIQKVFRFIKQRVEFVEDEEQLGAFGIPSDPRGQELLITPPYLLSMIEPKGDCDDFSMLCCSMLKASGVDCSFVTVAADESLPNQFTHVYCQALGSNGWIPVDCSHGREIGWETPRAHRKKIWPIISIGGLGLLVTRQNYSKDWAGQFRSSFIQGLKGLGACGDCIDWDENGNCQATDTSSCGSITPTTGECAYGGVFPNCNAPTAAQTIAVSSNPTQSSVPSITSTTSSFTTALDNLLPGIFGAAEKIAVQGSQPAGVQTQTCNAQGVCSTSSTVLPANYTGSLSIPGLSTSSMSSLLPLLLIGGAALFLFKEA